MPTNPCLHVMLTDTLCQHAMPTCNADKSMPSCHAHEHVKPTRHVYMSCSQTPDMHEALPTRMEVVIPMMRG
eukprot:78891-Pelagomonas_calceolata.AAC.4